MSLPDPNAAEQRTARDEIRRLCKIYKLVGEHVDPGGRVLTFAFGEVRLTDMDYVEDLARVRAFVDHAWDEHGKAGA